MQTTHPKPILNTSLPAQFRQIRIELAREPGHPEGDAAVGYVIVAPLDANDRIDARLWREHREACRIARLRPDEDDALGHLVHRPGGGWAFHYDAGADVPDEVGVHLADERFVLGEYVTIKEASKTHTYRVVVVSHL
ncbi:hypothetical protein [Bradyrhizobium sp.]|uniref:hypothetical protein n=1 Tax=Bradyrhizobium sp. TaxID=376 RepID=UPI003C780830